MDDLRKGRLKIATLDELNDPFELFAGSLPEYTVRQAFRRGKDNLLTKIGFLCFSRDWRNPVQWSHYSDKHRGLCLGFDVADDFVRRVVYSKRRIATAIREI